jgi:hypothetical protein
MSARRCAGSSAASIYISFLLPALMGLFAQVGGTETLKSGGPAS